MPDDFNVKCVDCGYDKFTLEFSGIHLAAYCANCGKLVKKDGYAFFLEQIEEQEYEPATGAQIASIKKRVYTQAACLSKIQAGDIISMLDKAYDKEFQRKLKEEEERANRNTY